MSRWRRWWRDVGTLLAAAGVVAACYLIGAYGEPAPRPAPQPTPIPIGTISPTDPAPR